jgi:hypothetical protein
MILVIIVVAIICPPAGGALFLAWFGLYTLYHLHEGWEKWQRERGWKRQAKRVARAVAEAEANARRHTWVEVTPQNFAQLAGKSGWLGWASKPDQRVFVENYDPFCNFHSHFIEGIKTVTPPPCSTVTHNFYTATKSPEA